MHQAIGALAIVLVAAQAAGPAQLLPNPSFEQGDRAPQAWTLEGNGRWVVGVAHSGRRCIAVKTTRRTDARWHCRAVKFEPWQVYEFSYWYRSSEDATGGCIVSGASFCNDDWGHSRGKWRHARFFFVAPRQLPSDAGVHLGAWHAAGEVFFDDVSLRRAQVLHERFDGPAGAIELGEGEEIDGRRYIAEHRMSGIGNNYCRFLHDFRCGFNSNRWTFGAGSYVIYRHELPGVKFASAKVKWNLNYRTSGQLVVEASADGRRWVKLATSEDVQPGEADVPNSLLPARTVYIRLRAAGSLAGEAERGAGDFQINQYRFEADLDRPLPAAIGSTAYLAPEVCRSDIAQVQLLAVPLRAGRHEARVKITAKVAGRYTCSVLLVNQRGRRRVFHASAPLRAGESRALAVPVSLLSAGTYSAELSVSRGRQLVYRASLGEITVPVIHQADFGYLISSGDAADLWWCEGSWKVGRERPAPQQRRPVMWLEAARNESEPVQLVIRPKRPLRGLTVSVSDFRGPAGFRLPSSIASVMRVEYVRIERPTDRAGCRGWWPDPIPPLRGPVDLQAGFNCPIWLLVKVPKRARPGVYEATVTLKAQGFEAQVPLRLRVFAFAIPDEVHVQTALGISQGNIWRYHNLTAPEDEWARRKVWDLYMQNWRDHHISPYQFWLEGIKVEVTGYKWQGGEPVTDNPHSGRYCLKVEDNNVHSNISASYRERIRIDRTKTYVLRLWARTATDGQKFMVTVGQFRPDGSWIPYHNLDFRLTGSTAWKQYELVCPPERFTPQTAMVDISLRGAVWVSDGSTTGTTWFDDVFFGEQGSNENLVEDPGFEDMAPEKVDVKVDFTAWDRYARKYLDGYHFTSFRLPVMGLGGGRYPNYNPGQFGPFRFGTPEYERLMGKYLRQLQDHLERNGWLRKAYIYWYDEPGEADYPFVVERMKLLKRLAPKLTRMLTEQPEPPLYGHVDLWCPVLHNYDPERCHARQKLGERVWWYVCCGPRAPWIGLFIDHPHTDMRAWLWATWKFNVQGCLIWQTNYWNCPGLFGPNYQNPWQDPMSYTASSRPGRVGYWGNGDGRFLYPPNRKGPEDKKTKYIEGPVVSYRWEQLRDGIEDFEYFWLLRELVRKHPGSAQARAAARLLRVPDSIIGPRCDQYTHEPTPMLRHRRAVAEAIERLMKLR